MPPTPERLQELCTMPYDDYLQTLEWQEQRSAALARAGFHCQLCNSEDHLHIHHKTYERRGQEAPDDLTVLCEKCHSWFHLRLSNLSRHDFTSLAATAEHVLDQNKSSSDLSTGYPDLDRLLGGGIQRPDLVLIGGRGDAGVTAFLMNILSHIASSGHTVAFFSLSMSQEQVLDYLLALTTHIPLYRLHPLQLEDDEWERYKEMSANVANLPIYLYNGFLDSDEMPQKLFLFSQKQKFDLIVLDQCQLAFGKKYGESAGRLFIRKLKMLARQFNVPVIATCHFAEHLKTVYDRQPTLAHFRDVDIAPQDADVILLTHREEIFHPDTERKNLLDILVPKQRSGLVGEVTFYFNPTSLLVRNLEVASEES